MKRLIIVVMAGAMVLTGCKVSNSETYFCSFPPGYEDEIETTPQPIPTAEVIATPTEEVDSLKEFTSMLEMGENSINGVFGNFEGWGHRESYGYYIVHNPFGKNYDEDDPYKYGYLTLWIEMDNGELSPVEEHIKNGSVVYAVGVNRLDEYGNVYVPFYCDFVKHPTKGVPHENGIYWLLCYSATNGRMYMEVYDYD